MEVLLVTCMIGLLFYGLVLIRILVNQQLNRILNEITDVSNIEQETIRIEPIIDHRLALSKTNKRFKD